VTEFSPLQSEIKKLIKSSGPMPVWRYMELCLLHPEHGYYVSRDPLGREGDFTTSPEISQMFGELLGLWAASVWKAMGSPQQPTTEQYAQLQAVAGLQLLTSPVWTDVVDGRLDLTTELPRQSISLVTITW